MYTLQKQVEVVDIHMDYFIKACSCANFFWFWHVLANDQGIVSTFLTSIPASLQFMDYSLYP